MFFGLILIIIGLVFLLQNLGFIGNDAWPIIWPCLVVALGISILLKRRRHKEKWEKFEEGMHKFGKGMRETFGDEDK